MLRPSRFFRPEEFTASATARRLQIDNSLPKELEEDAQRLLAYLDEVRSAFGSPVRISSGYRCPALNKAVGGKDTSQHTQGLAADLQAPELSRLFRTVRALGGFDQLIWEEPAPHRRWVHVSVAPATRPPRGQVLRYDGRGFKPF